MGQSQKDIINYYDECEGDYRLFWNLEKSLAMHAGYWDDTTNNLTEALERENQILAESVRINSNDRVLDAGCGVGGSAIFLANRYQCHVTGITLSENQAEKAKHYAAERVEANHRPIFCVRDYTETGFPDQSFTVVWGLESVCHAPNKRDFIEEAYRLLEPRGRLVIADGFAAKNHYNGDECRLMDIWLNGFGVHSLETIEEFKAHLENVGFKKVVFTDITHHVLPSSKKLFFYSYIGLPFAKTAAWLGLCSPKRVANLLSARCQYRAIVQNLWRYGIFTAEK
jgi:cyclopropane fatty-acyl-phospholipid synthase-like methyltransferase